MVNLGHGKHEILLALALGEKKKIQDTLNTLNKIVKYSLIFFSFPLGLFLFHLLIGSVVKGPCPWHFCPASLMWNGFPWYFSLAGLVQKHCLELFKMPTALPVPRCCTQRFHLQHCEWYSWSLGLHPFHSLTRTLPKAFWGECVF